MLGRTRYVWQDGKLVEVDDNYRQNRRGWQVMPDIQPYTSMIDGSIIGSRNTHRAHLKQHNCIEVGNEKQVSRLNFEVPGLKRTIIDLANERLRY